MRLGRCLPTHTGFIGCQSNVLTYFDKECSDKQTCDVLVFDNHINAQGGCIKGLQCYLEAEYRCVKGKHTLSIHSFSFIIVSFH